MRVVGEVAHVADELRGGLGGQQRRQVGRVRAGDHQREQPPHAGHCACPVRSTRIRYHTSIFKQIKINNALDV